MGSWAVSTARGLCVWLGGCVPYLNLLMEKEMAKSLEVGVPHFQKDVIIPEIYNLENIKLIQSCSYPESPPNKVAQLKKRNIQNVIKAIITKPHTATHSRNPRPASAKKTTFDDKSYKQILASQADDGLLMDLDDQLGELLSLMEENLAPTTDRIQAVLGKVACYLTTRNDQQKQAEVLRYLAKCPKPPLKTNPEQTRPIKGLVEELEDLRKSGIRSPLKRRVQSAKVVGTRHAEEFAQRQGKSRLLERSTGNLKAKQAFSEQIAKSKQLITMINDCLGEEEKGRRGYERKLGEMRGEWAQQSRLERTLLRSRDLPLNAETLGILREKRLKQQGVARIDRNHFQ